MKKRLTTLACALMIGAARNAFTQYAPPPPPSPFPGFLNEALRKNDPYMKQWDFTRNARVRYEYKSGYAIPGVGGSIEFRYHGADTLNQYMMEKIRFRAAYTEKWWNVWVEGRSSLVQEDKRWAYTNTPPI